MTIYDFLLQFYRTILNPVTFFETAMSFLIFASFMYFFIKPICKVFVALCELFFLKIKNYFIKKNIKKQKEEEISKDVEEIIHLIVEGVLHNLLTKKMEKYSLGDSTYKKIKGRIDEISKDFLDSDFKMNICEEKDCMCCKMKQANIKKNLEVPLDEYSKKNAKKRLEGLEKTDSCKIE